MHVFMQIKELFQKSVLFDLSTKTQSPHILDKCLQTYDLQRVMLQNAREF